ELPLPRVGLLHPRARVLPDRGPARAGGLAGGAGSHLADALLPPPPAGLHDRARVVRPRARPLAVVRARERAAHRRAGLPGAALARGPERGGAPTPADR